MCKEVYLQKLLRTLIYPAIPLVIALLTIPDFKILAYFFGEETSKFVVMLILENLWPVFLLQFMLNLIVDSLSYSFRTRLIIIGLLALPIPVFILLLALA